MIVIALLGMMGLHRVHDVKSALKNAPREKKVLLIFHNCEQLDKRVCKSVTTARIAHHLRGDRFCRRPACFCLRARRTRRSSDNAIGPLEGCFTWFGCFRYFGGTLPASARRRRTDAIHLPRLCAWLSGVALPSFPPLARASARRLALPAIYPETVARSWGTSASVVACISRDRVLP